MLIFDIETNGLLPDVSRIHCVVSYDTVTQFLTVSNSNDPKKLEEHLKDIMFSSNICGHNVIAYDIPVIQHLYPWFKPEGKVTDTFTMSSVIYSNMKEMDWAMDAKKNGKWIPKNLYGRHSLEAWGARLGCPKDDYQKRCKEKGIDPWAEWNQDMEDYCEQDVMTTAKLWEKLDSKNYSEECLELEHAVQTIIARQERHGFLFDVEAAGKLYAELKERQQELYEELQTQYPPWEVKLPDFIPKRNNKTKGYVAGVPVPRSKIVTFNPSSGDHVAFVLQRDFKWKPTEFTPNGKPKVSEEVLEGLKFEGVEKLVEYQTVTKRISQLAEGKQAWMKKYRMDTHRIHGRVQTNGCITGRMTHSNPNMAQIPASYSPYGKECRALFTVPKGKKLVGADAEGLELRALAHYMGLYDQGVYAKAVVSGTKEEETDPHTLNMKALGMNSRDNSKTFIYAFLYGAGAFKLGSIIYDDMDSKTRPKASKKLFVQLGKKAVRDIESNFPALKKLTDAVKSKAISIGHLKGLDGRLLPIRSSHAALNTLLQSLGAVLMKKAIVIADEKIRAAGIEFGQVGMYHDELQYEVEPKNAELVGKLMCEAMTEAGEHFNLRCPISGSWQVGDDWSATH